MVDWFTTGSAVCCFGWSVCHDVVFEAFVVYVVYPSSGVAVFFACGKGASGLYRISADFLGAAEHAIL